MQFIDLAAQQAHLRPRIDAAVARVLDHGRYIMGPEVAELEAELTAWGGSGEVVTCASGTDALVMALMALGVRRGDAVFVPTFTFAATAEAVALLGATPVFVDILPDTFNIDPASLSAAIEACPPDLRRTAVIPVDLFGQPADYQALGVAAGTLHVIADAAQSFGGSSNGTPVGSLAPLTTASFFPAKPLGCYGDGGAVFVDDPDVAVVLRSLRVHGSGGDKYDNVRIGINGRLDTLQAAILLQKLTVFSNELVARQAVADRYDEGLCDVAVTPRVVDGMRSAWAQYTLRVPSRDHLVERLRELGIPTAIYYSLPLHLQTAYREFPRAPGGLPVAELAATEVLSLPMHPYLGEDDQAKVIEAVRAALR